MMDSASTAEIERILDSFSLNPAQRRAAAARGRDVVVTAGAGSGKTRTLAARYITLLAEGFSPRRVTAITFTEKAAREMRSRVRAALVQQIALAAADHERRRWSSLEAQMDSARIGTIHSLCAEILRAHPAEAGVDPRFEVLEEGLSAALRAEAAADTLAWLAGEADFAPLLQGLNTGSVEKLLVFLLDRRLDAADAFERGLDARQIITKTLSDALRRPDLHEPLDELRRMQAAGTLAADAGEKLARQIEDLFSLWGRALKALEGGNGVEAAALLFTARRTAMRGGAGGRTSRARALLAGLKDAYDRHLDPWLGGQDSKDTPPDEAVEKLFGQTLPLLRRAFDHLLQTYQTALRRRQALDFDSLEAGAASLLAQPGLLRRWQGEMDALLVDEFQDTNARQRAIVLALCGETPGRLFVVGDSRQSIYRFRRADVTVFSSLQEETRRRGGLVIDLDLTYRAHTPLLQAAGSLLEAVMGAQPDPERPYYVPFSPLRSDHDLPRDGMLAPHVEFVLGVGEDAESARPAAAQALARRLLDLRQEGQIRRWEDAALLFRASSGFPHYEDALEAAGIPFVTVAGQGFYNRPEIRDLLNLLRALADPWDDLAMAGLLRSPAFGLSDSALYRLRWRSGQTQPYWAALQGSLEQLDEPDQALARRAAHLLRELQPLVDRLPVAELLKLLADSADYRAILASAETAAGRLWRNLDKLLDDAQASGLVNVRAFLEYLDTLREAGAREGEAPAEAEGAVCLMTIHKAKGLEFPLVVLADAARRGRNTGEAAYLLPETGPAFRFDPHEPSPLLYRLAKMQDARQSEAEEKRLLYVALTRAQEKLLISGHCTSGSSGSWKADGWLGSLAQAGRVDLEKAINGGGPFEAEAPGGHPLRVWALPPAAAAAQAARPPGGADWPESAAQPLYRSLLLPEPDDEDPEPNEAPRPRRATGAHLRPPAEALGLLVHRAIQRWVFPGSSALPGLLEAAALEAGLADPLQRAEAVRLAEMLLARLRQHPLWLEIDQAAERRHEVPFARLTAAGRFDTGYIDLLYRSAEGGSPPWQIVDFKTDSLRSADARQAALEQHRRQMRRYAQAALHLLGEPARVRVCFLDDDGQVGLYEL